MTRGRKKEFKPPKFYNMANYAFNTDAETTYEAMGFSEERADFFIAKSREVCLRALLTDKEIDNDVKALEALINETQPANVVEAMFVGNVFGQTYAKVAQMAAVLNKALSGARRDEE